MIPRTLILELRRVASYYPIVTLTGPRQSGKTTLCRLAFPDKRYVSLEPIDIRSAAIADPRHFLEEHSHGAIFDEVQHVPELFTYLQSEVDARPAHGRFILTGSQNFGMTASISQSLAGRSGMLALLPPSIDELRRFDNAPEDLFTTLWAGAYPRIFNERIPAGRWLADYVTTYVERDVRQLLNVGDLTAFTTFLKLCAGRTAQLVNLSDLGASAGVSQPTAKAWLSVLEASYLVFRIPAWHQTVRKQATRAAKLHFSDTGLACHLLGIRSPDELRHHPLRGAIFETWVATEILKARTHRGLTPSLFHFRDAKGVEVDLVVQAGERLALVEAKSGATVADDFFHGLRRLGQSLAGAGAAAHRRVERVLVFGGDVSAQRSDVKVVPWRTIDQERWGDE